MANKNLNTARVQKEDEFYTQIEDIEKELRGGSTNSIYTEKLYFAIVTTQSIATFGISSS